MAIVWSLQEPAAVGACLTSDSISGDDNRAGEAPSSGLTEALLALGFETDRLKTGTPPRVDSRTVNFGALEVQPGDEDVRWFSFDPEARPCYSL